jgi:subtilisin family serine protease
MKRNIIILFLVVFISNTINSQENTWFYLTARDTVFNPQFKSEDSLKQYIGTDTRLKSILKKYNIHEFKKTYKTAKKEDWKKTFFVISEEKALMDDLLNNASYLFKSGKIVSEEDKKIYEPNDYGLTSTIGKNEGLQVNLDYLDYIGAPQAWYYTTGSRDVIVGISDGSIDTTNPEFEGKTTIYHKSNLAGGHGLSIAANAAAQGDNGYGIPGICYDCSLFGTNYGSFKYLKEVKELSDAGARVVSCSWVGKNYYPEAQEVVNEIFNNGTIIVAASGNKKWRDTKGELKHYPASYKHVISVGAVMYRFKSPLDNILIEEKNGKYYSENVRGYLGRTMGFKDNDTLKETHIYQAGIATLNEEVDILAPTVGLFSFGEYIVNGLESENIYSRYETTSGATPLVSGTIGLMFSLAPCLPVDEVESILKMTATNIDNIEANKPYAGNYGAGILHTGRAVKMVHDLYSPLETVYIENQFFSRWDFKITSYAESVVIRNQEFTENATLTVASKNKIVIGENTILKPNQNGKIRLYIDTSLEKRCDLVLRKDKK